MWPVVIKHWIKFTNKGAQQVSSWWVFSSLYFWTIKEHYLVISPHGLFKCEHCDHEATQKHLLNTHKHVGTRYKCNQCGQIEIQWCNLKSHKQRKCIHYQCDQCDYKVSNRKLPFRTKQAMHNWKTRVLRIEKKFQIVKECERFSTIPRLT